MIAWNNYNLVSEVISLQHLRDLPKLLEIEGMLSIYVFYVGGLVEARRVDCSMEAEAFLHDEHNWNR